MAVERFSEFVEHALYGPDGFYERGGVAGRRGDFITSPELGSLFAEVLLRAVHAWGASRFIDVGAGRGTLAAQLRALDPQLDVVAVERSAALRAQHDGPALAELPSGPLDGVVFANELLDNLPFDLLERRVGEWFDVCVDNGREVLVPARQPLPIDAPDGARVPVQRAAAAFVDDVCERLTGGSRLVLIDYVSTTAEMAARPWSEWLRTYRGHRRSGHPLDQPGTQDITCEVAVDQLRAPDVNRTQAEFLNAHGLTELRDAARDAWHARAHIGDLEALRWKSRMSEADALADPEGLGGFRVLEWIPERSG